MLEKTEAALKQPMLLTAFKYKAQKLEVFFLFGPSMVGCKEYAQVCILQLSYTRRNVANVWNNLREEELFYKGYGNTNINRVILAYYRHERIVQDIAEYGQALLLTSGGEGNRLEMYKHFMDMFEANGVVDIAFKTDEELGHD